MCKNERHKIFEIIETLDTSGYSSQMTYVLIDDDKLIHYSWTTKAAKLNYTMLCFLSFEDFINESVNLSRDAHIYIDSNLGKELKGEELTKTIFELGFMNINLCTGHTDIDITNYPWIKSVISKRPPF